MNSILFEEETQRVFVGDTSSSVFEYQFKKNFKEYDVNKYNDLKIGEIRSLIKYKNVMIVGGFNSFRVLDLEDKEVIGQKFQTPFQAINSLEICKIRNKKKVKYLLSITGGNPDYSNKKSDILVITHLIHSKTQRYLRIIREIYENCSSKKSKSKLTGNIKTHKQTLLMGFFTEKKFISNNLKSKKEKKKPTTKPNTQDPEMGPFRVIRKL